MDVGQEIGNYRLIEKLGEGGMGAVYLAEHKDIGRKAAIKIMHPQFSSDPQFSARFLNEARVVNVVQHPGLVEIFEFGAMPDGTKFIIMEYLQGESLSKLIARAGSTRLGSYGLWIARQIAMAIAAAHEHNIIHRDLKPDNVMIVKDRMRPGAGVVKVLDFGIAKMVQAAPGGPKTQTGVAMGTPEYMAPEQCLGEEITDRADVYAMGIILYELLTGNPPFSASLPFVIMGMQVKDAPRPLREVNSQIPAELAALVHRMLDKNPKLRPSMPQVAEALVGLGATDAAAITPTWLPLLSESSSSSQVDPLGKTALPTSSGLLAAAAGETDRQPAARERRRALLLIPAALGLLAVGGGFLALRHGQGPAPASQKAEPEHVTWSVTTRPVGAEVRDANGKFLGVTPWQHASPKGIGTARLVLELKGYAPRTIELDRSHEETREEALAPGVDPALDKAAGAAAAGSDAAAADSHKQPPKQRAVSKHKGRKDEFKLVGE